MEDEGPPLETTAEPTQYGAFEAALTSLPDVRAARVVATPQGRITEIHIVGAGGKSAKQLVRDVQSVAQASFQLEIDHRVISVVHFGDEPVPDAVTPVRLAGVSWSSEGSRATCRVRVQANGESFIGEADGPSTLLGRSRLTAQAAIGALNAAASAGSVVDIAESRFVDVGGRRVAVAVVIELHGEDEVIVAGSALVRGDESEALVRAIIDAHNRHREA